MDVFIRVALYLIVMRTLLAALHRPMEATKSILGNVYLFIILSHLH